MSQPNAANPLEIFSTVLADLAARVSPGIVGVHARGARASGFVWKPGLIVTADEALPDEGDISITFADGASAPAKLVGRDVTTDIALLRVESDAGAPASLVTSAPAAGSLAIVVGSAHASPEVALGVVSLSAGEWRGMRGGEISARIELGLSLRKTSEGGLAVDANGRPFGMAVFGPRRRVLVIPTATIERVASTLETHGRIPRGYLGLGLQRVKVEGGDVGVMAMSVDPKGPAAAAGVRQGDVIVALNGAPVGGVRGLMRSLGASSIGTAVKLSLKRGGEPVDVGVIIGERRDD
jgi:S1-C subfamily serine protease